MNDHTNHSTPPPAGDEHRRLILVGILLVVVIGLFIGGYRLFAPENAPKQDSDKDRKPKRSTEVSSSKSVFKEKYADITALINEFKHVTALDKLRELDNPQLSTHDRFIQGVLYAWLGDDESASRLLTEAARTNSEPLSSRILANHASKWKIDPVTIGYRHFTTEDTRYIRRCFFLKTIADRVAGEDRPDREKLDRLLEWVFRHVGFFEPKLIDVSPVDVLMRGYGLCDRSAWVLSLLCNRAGLPANLVFLGQPVPNLSNHTLCQVLVSGRWLLCDTTQGIVLTFEDGSPATLDEIVRRLNRKEEDSAFGTRYDSFEQAGVGVVCEADGAFPRFELLEPYLRCMPPYASAYVDLQSRFETALTCLDTDRETEVQIGFWDYPFFSRSSYNNPDFIEKRREVMSRTLHYQDARTSQLLGLSDRAMFAYAKALEDAPADAKEDILFFTAQSQQEAGHLEAAESNYMLYLSSCPEGRWKKLVTYHLARLKEKQGEYAAAISFYREIEGVSVAKQRISTLEEQSQP